MDNIDRYNRYSFPLKRNSISEDYNVDWNSDIGSGITGTVRTCQCCKTGKKFALKTLPDEDKSWTEIELQWKCGGHPHIVTIAVVYLNRIQLKTDTGSKFKLLIVMELMEGGELFARISKLNCLTEKQAAMYTKQIALGIQRCHSLGICHRDVKAENILLTDNSDDGLVKMCDFGFAKVDDGKMSTPSFTAYYAAPQVLEASRRKQQQLTPYYYDKSCDMWSLGVLVYILLCGYPPFYSEIPSISLTKQMKNRIAAADYEFPQEDWMLISSNAINLIKSLLTVDTTQRLTVEQVLLHPWLCSDAPLTPLSSFNVFGDQLIFAGVKEAHSHHLSAMRTPERKPVILKPMEKLNNKFIKKLTIRDKDVKTSAENQK